MGIKKRKSPEKINHLITNLMKKWKTGSEQKSFLLQTLWVKIVGEQVAGHTKLDHITRGKLVVHAQNAAWMNELTFMKETIKIKAKSLFLEHQIEVNDVVFKLGNEKLKP